MFLYLFLTGLLLQVMLVVLMRRAEWHINVEEKVAYFPITTPADGLPMTLAAKA